MARQAAVYAELYQKSIRFLGNFAHNRRIWYRFLQKGLDLERA